MEKYFLILQYQTSDSGKPEGGFFEIYGPVEAEDAKKAWDKFDAVFPGETDEDIIKRGKVPIPAPGGCHQSFIAESGEAISIDKDFNLYKFKNK